MKNEISHLLQNHIFLNPLTPFKKKTVNFAKNWDILWYGAVVGVVVVVVVVGVVGVVGVGVCRQVGFRTITFVLVNQSF